MKYILRKQAFEIFLDDMYICVKNMTFGIISGNNMLRMLVEEYFFLDVE